MHVQRGQVDLTTYGTAIRACEKGRRRQLTSDELLEVMHVQRGQADLTSVRAGMALVSADVELQQAAIRKHILGKRGMALPEQGRPR